MTGEEWTTLSDRISLLWPPAMSARHVDAYWSVLEELPAIYVDRAISGLARQPRSFRPDAGLIYETARALLPTTPALPAAEVDPLTEAEHQRVLEENRHRQSAEHRRRHEAVMDLLRSAGYRIPMTELPELMATRYCGAEEFDRRIAAYRQEAVGRRSA